MKIGDKVKNTVIRNNDVATVVKVDIIKGINKVNKKPFTSTKYTAQFADGSCFYFYGSSINKTVFKEKDREQLDLSEFMSMEV